MQYQLCVLIRSFLVSVIVSRNDVTSCSRRSITSRHVCVVLQEIYPGQFQPSVSHRFIRLLEQHDKLLRNFTQNIDTLEQVAGIELKGDSPW